MCIQIFLLGIVTIQLFLFFQLTIEKYLDGHKSNTYYLDTINHKLRYNRKKWLKCIFDP